MPLSKQDLLAKFDASGIAYELLEHEAVPTVEAQAQALGGAAGTIIKNLFLKDKKGRLYVISALAPTKVDLKVLSARMGLGKGGIRMAEAELVEEVLKVGQGAVTPLVVANPEAAGVTLLLDHKIQGESKVFVHPLVNTASLAMTPKDLQSSIELLGRTANFIDLEADPKIDREHPPDLAKYVPEAPTAAAPAAAPSADAPATQPAAPAAKEEKKPAAKKAAGKEQPAKASKPQGDALAAQHCRLSDVSMRTEDVLQKTAQALLGCKLEDAKISDPYILARLKADVEMQLNALKNAAYTAGYLAGKGEVVGFAERRYA